ncbi:very-long-chain (3R)-3-hydroxyacyl-CoA dehydratase hpo-8-like isoform X2 [Paramacrobiotus metropolitanus]|uniref:very-long-chain (3R)-3-hydroxyacyl-CoA dehydratase hpo-8-like isoform X2 n=1 Tax=Paramacrobiotus metropolitanus TaxID=2943436 RepID=UPI002445E2AF|nr:very-long-chain (3R)-3-hydroxyacyl-CoA dehydratase hpo-8-like isoform X2 [Paramacrobiotus metropolitanus]
MLAWTVIGFQMLSSFRSGKDLYASVNPALQFFQTLAVAEIVHAAVGFVKSSPLLTGFQVFSRVFVVWAVLDYSVEARDSVGFPMLLICWTLAEMTRYAFYAANLINMDAPVLTWLRYTMFIVLYPIGITGELLATWQSMNKIVEKRPYCYSDNAVNWVWYVYVGLMLTYIPVFPKLYLYMLHQRKKVLGHSRPAKREGKKVE